MVEKLDNLMGEVASVLVEVYQTAQADSFAVMVLAVMVVVGT
jgi:uncharacterized pyridoxamine 5'-phosphate oxidase family protein